MGLGRGVDYVSIEGSSMKILRGNFFIWTNHNAGIDIPSKIRPLELYTSHFNNNLHESCFKWIDPPSIY
jgi:hypothetical protein